MNIKEQITNILLKGDTTRDNLLFQLKGGVSDRQMRKIIAEEMPQVGSCHRRGYFLIRTEADLKDSISDLRSKAKSIFKRAEQQHTNFGMKFQPELLFK